MIKYILKNYIFKQMFQEQYEYGFWKGESKGFLEGTQYGIDSSLEGDFYPIYTSNGLERMPAREYINYLHETLNNNFMVIKGLDKTPLTQEEWSKIITNINDEDLTLLKLKYGGE